MGEPTVSVAMATYNGERFIAEQLESFARQERLPDELVVSDDGSSDRTVEIVREFARKAPFSVHVFVSEGKEVAGLEERGGRPSVADSVNGNFGRAIERCHGDLIFLSDQDDCWYPQKVRVMVSALEEAPGAALAVCNSDQADEQLRPLGVTTWAARDRFFPTRRLIRSIGRGNTFRLSMPASGCCMAFRGRLKPLVLPIPGAEGARGVAYDLFIARTLVCAGAGGAILLPEPLQAYRRHAQQATHAPRPPLFKQVMRRSVTRHGLPSHLSLLLSRVESDCAERFCRNEAMRLSVMRHCRARLNMPRSFVARLPVVAGELAALRYHRFSSGWASAAKDLFFSRRVEERSASMGAVMDDPTAAS